MIWIDMNLTLKQKEAIKTGDCRHKVARQLEKKQLARIEEEFRHPKKAHRVAVLELTEAGEKLKRMIEDPTQDHI